MLNQLGEDLSGLDLPTGTRNSLASKIKTALKVLGDSNEKNDVAACNALGAFIHSLEAQIGKKVSEADADEVIGAAEEIMEGLGCS